MNALIQSLDGIATDLADSDLMFIEDSSLEWVGGGTITNTL